MIKFINTLFCLAFLSGCVPENIKNSQSVLVNKGENKPGIPTHCLDPSGQFKPVKTIITRLNYNEKAHVYQPIQNKKGLISQDFNNNGKMDYLFVERSKATQKLRLASCIDHVYKATRFIIHEEKQPDFQSIHEAIRLYQGKLQLSINKHEHNWGSDNETSLYRYDKQRKDFVLIERLLVSSSGDGLRSDTEEHYNLLNKRYRRSSQCGSLEEACRSKTQKGRIVLSRTPIRLFKSGGKLYQRLIPDE